MSTGVKTCTDCDQILLIDEFYPRSDRPGQHQSYCKSCATLRGQEYRKKNPDAGRKAAKKWYENGGSHTVREYTLRNKYGISSEQFDELNESQSGLCAICKSKPTRKRLCVDHCHETGEVRGLLCVKCNQALGLFQESTQLLRVATQYLEETGNSKDICTPQELQMQTVRDREDVICSYSLPN